MKRLIKLLFIIFVPVLFSCSQKEPEIPEVVVEPITLNQTAASLIIGETLQLTASISPSASNKEVQWSSNNPSIASVNSSGLVSAISEGTVTITAFLGGNNTWCNVSVKKLAYQAVPITDLKPVELMPGVGNVVSGDKQVYDHIEHLRIAEAMRIRNMMREYGAGSFSKEEYQQLMDRLVVAMSNECPPFPKTFEVVGRGFTDLSTWGGKHASVEWDLLNMIVPNTRRIVEINGFYDESHDSFYTEKPEQIDWINMEAFLAANPNSIVILARSSDAEYYDRYYEHGDDANLREFCRSGKLIFFKSGGNIGKINGVWIDKCFHKDVETDGHGLYGTQSIANSKNDEVADMSLFVSIGTDATGDIDQTGYIYESSCFPVGFHDKVLFAGRSLPIRKDDGTYSAFSGHYATSFANYYNAAIMSLCFQMYAEAKDVFDLLDIVRSTCLTDYIRLDGQTQPLQLINPAGLYKKYLTPQNIPTTISTGETLDLEKGYYKGVIFNIPGAEIKINGEWVAFDNENKDVIRSQNPMNLEWRLNGDLLRKMGYTSGQKIEGQVITVDDKWGGLRLEVPMSVVIK